MPDASRLQELLDQWRRLAVSGIVLSADDLCLDHPELRTELQRRIAELQEQPQFVETLLPGESELPGEPPSDTVWQPRSLNFNTRLEGVYFYKRGGLGDLYIGREDALQRQVALKFIQNKFADDAETRARFVAEAEITARLDHPGVVPVYGLGRLPEGRPFLVMRLIRGRTLDEALEEFHKHSIADPGEKSVAFRGLLSKVISVCHTLAYAHNRGILHRDVKPQNVMLGKYGETLVVDWGLAMSVNRAEVHRASGEDTLTPESSISAQTTGGAVGTPSYMSPEQAHGDIPLTPAADVYSLGAMLFKVLTGVVPVTGRSSSEILEKVKRGDFPHPRKLQHDVARPLEAICLKAMAFTPEERYTTATEMADDIERWLADEPVHAYQERGVEWVRRTIRRHRTWAQAIGLSVLTLLLVGIPAGVWFRSSLIEQDRIAKQLQVNRLREGATYAAATFADEINLRWRILQRDADDVTLRTLMQSGRPFADLRKDLDQWLRQRAEYNSEFTSASSWFIIDDKGLQLARNPRSDTTGKSYRFRTYFHGGEFDLPRDQPLDVPVYEDLHRSIVFESTTTQLPQINFSAPIWDSPARKKVVGRLGMTVQLGKFRSLNQGLAADQAALLIDLRRYNEGRSGVVLQHPAWDKGLPKETSIDNLPTLPAELVNQINDLRRRQQRDHTVPPLTLVYEDPVGGKYRGQWLATFEPVLIGDRDTGMAVIVQTRAKP